MTQITVTEQGGTGRYISFGDAAALRDLFNNPNGATIIAYVKPGDQAAINYLFCKCDSSGYGMRFTNTTTEQLGCAVYRGGGTSQVSGATSGSYTQGTWQHWQVSHPGNGSLLGAGLNFFIDDSASLTKTLVTDATSPIASDSGLTAMILNRTGLGRHWIGDVAYVAAWNRVLSDIERATVRTNGPLDVPSGLVFCFANGQDYGPNAVAVVGRTTQVAGSTPTNTNLGGSAAINVTASNSAQANTVQAATIAQTHLVTAAESVQSNSASSVSVSDTATHSITVSNSTQNNTASSVAIQATQPIVIYDTADRGTLDLASCSVVPNGTTPTINIKNMYAWEENASGARNCFFHLTGMIGMRPIFDVDRSNMQLTDYTGKFKWSYTGERGTWNDFTSTTRVTSPNVYRSQHADAFTQDTVYVSMANPWRIGYTLPWIQSLESTGFVSYAPSGGASYQFETRSATTDHLGAAIGAQPLYSFKISSGAGNAPDGNPKRKLVMMSGVHAAEDAGNYALKGAVEFLISSDPLAISVRAWFDAYVYPVVAAAGRAGGAQRGDFQAGALTADVNRAWDGAPVLEVVTKHKSALATDVGSTVHVFMDFHGDHTTTANTSFFEGASGDAYGAKWDAAIDTHQVTTIVYSSSAEFSTGWIKANKSCPYNLTPECGYLGEWTPASKEAFGAANIKAIGTLISQGEWTIPNSLNIANSAQTNTASTAAVNQTHLIGISNSSQGSITIAGSVTQDSTTFISAANSAQASQCSAGSIAQTHLIISAPVAVDHVASASSVVQAHLVVAASSVQSNAVSDCSAGEVPVATLTAADLAAIDSLITARLSDIAAVVLAAAQVSPIHADMRKTNNVTIIGTGVPPTYANEPTVLDPGDPFRVA